MAIAIAGLTGALALGAASAGAQLPDTPTAPDTPTVPDTDVPDTSTVPDPYAAGEEAADEHNLPDTDYTPVAKDSQLWTQLHGAHYPEDDVGEDSVTDFRDSLVTVSFANPNRGAAGGFRRIDCDGIPTDVPVLYTYRDIGGTGLTWRRDFVGTCDRPGFVGAVAWMPGTSEIVAVGGTGTYPYRESAYRPECQKLETDPETGAVTNVDAYGVLCDQAGDARAWRFSGARWREITGELPTDPNGDPPRGMTALDFSPTRDEFGFAGSLGQIWRWQGGQFDRLYDMHMPCPRVQTDPTAPAPAGSALPYNPRLGGAVTDDCKFVQAYRFRFRVRQIRFHFAEPPTAFAVTDGCCAEDRLHNDPNILAYTERGQPQRWFAGTLDPARSLAYDEGAGSLTNEEAVGLKDSEHRRLNTRQDMPESLYAFAIDPKNTGVLGTRIGAVASTAAPEGSGPERSFVTQPYCATMTGRHASGFSFSGVGTEDQTDIPDQLIEALRLRLSTARLVAGDGDMAASFSASNTTDLELGNERVAGTPAESSVGASTCTNGTSPRDEPDGVPDWTVGELRSTKTALGSQGLVYSTVLRPDLVPTTVQPNPDLLRLLQGELPTDQDKLRAYLAAQLFRVTSYSLNAVDVIGATDTGWAVGEHGAIVRLGGAGRGAGPEPDPPKMGSRQPASVAAGGSYTSGVPTPAGAPGPVPPLAARPRLHLDEPRMFSAGSPFPANDGGLDPIEGLRQIVMSRDGREGWAVGPAAAGGSLRVAMTTLFHYDGESWSRCDPVGVKGQVPPDTACEELAPLRDYHNTFSRLSPAPIVAATRIPLEYDTDPSNDDEFEVMALAGPFRAAETDTEGYVPIRYADGRWRIDPDPELGSLVRNSGLLTIAFATPSDGWILARDDIQTPNTTLLHFDGTHWANCTPGGAAPPGCGDPGCAASGSPGLLCFKPTGALDPVRGMVANGRDVFLYGSRERGGVRYPFIIRWEPGGEWTADPEAGGYDPVAATRAGGAEPEASARGEVQSLGMTQRDGELAGWAVGSFSSRGVDPSTTAGVKVTGLPRKSFSPATSLLRLGAGGWEPFDDSGPVGDYLKVRLNSTGYCPIAARCLTDLPDTDSNLQLTLPGPETPSGPDAFIAQRASGRIFGFYPERGRWELIDQPRNPAQAPSGLGNDDGWLDGQVKTLAPDGAGGIWAAVGDDLSNVPHDDFEHFTASPPAPVFTEAPSPLREGESFTSLAGSTDGAVWASTRSGTLMRYDRVLGWDRISIPGWDPGRIVTRPSRALAVAVGPTGDGVAVGERGRIADLSPSRVVLDRAAGCSRPCGTGRDLLSAAVASDGSAIAGGEAMALLWRSSNGDFQTINPPDAGSTDSITGVSMANPGEAYVATSSGQVFRGTGGAGGWSWTRENLNEAGDIITLDRSRNPIRLRAIAVDSIGHGYAVGDDGLLLERVGSGETAWRRPRTPFADDLTSVALGAGGGAGALIGGRNGLILTARGRDVSLARSADRAAMTGPVVGLALAPAGDSGGSEAWAVTAAKDGTFDPNGGLSQLFHYASDPGDAWLDPGSRATALPDAPTAGAGEVSFAAMGRAECRVLPSRLPCLDMNGSAQDYEVAAKRAVAEIAGLAASPGGPAFTLFTGDSVDTAGTPGVQQTERQADGGVGAHETVNGPRKLRRFREAVLDELTFAGVPMFAAGGGQDLSGADACYGVSCPVTTRGVAGDNLAWRQTFAGEAAPWGAGEPPVAGSEAGEGLSFEPVPDSPEAVSLPAPSVSDPDEGLPTGDGPLRSETVGIGGARTHYAVDITRDGKKVARLVVADSSLRSLQASDPLQQPVEPKGQLLWLDRMTCVEGESATDGSPCTREAGQQAIVLTNTPTYSYGPGALTDTDTVDGSQVEQILMQNRANVVVSGRLGWNGLYYATTPGLHYPCAGGTHPSGPPESTAPCGAEGGAAAAPPDRVLPFVVASDVAGTFGPDGQATGSAADGFWHGYTIVRLAPDGDPAKTIVEQRPVLDWIQIQPRRSQGDTHTVRAGKRLELVGVGREPIAASTATRGQATRFDEISTPAITHRFDLLEADPDRPWMPRQGTRADACDPYDCVSPSVATIDPQSGQVQAMNGNYPRTYAVAELSVGGQAATYPLVFQPRASFRASPPPPPVPVAVAPPASPPAPAQPTAPSVNLPAAPVLPVLTAQALAPPPLPPAPPTFASEAPLDLNLSPAALDATPPTAVSQPPTPPVNPAPPSGARREARQRQAAAQKSGADSEQGAESGREAADGGDLADGPASPGGNPMSRNDFSAIAHREQPSAWARNALLGGGLGIAALILALGATGRPTPRRREPEIPAPAQSQARNFRA